MPLYDFKCSKCDHVFERLVTFSKVKDVKEEACPNCSEIGFVDQFIQGKFLSFESDATMRPQPEFGQWLKKLKDNTKGASPETFKSV